MKNAQSLKNHFDMNNDFEYVVASYRKERDSAYAGNIFVEALPALFSRQEFAQALTTLPTVTTEDRLAEVEHRLTLLGSLSSMCLPLSRVIDLAQAMHRLLILGYRSRKPFTTADRDNRRHLYQAQQEGKIQAPGLHHRANQLSLALFGNPGSGKSFIMREIANLFPPVIFHEDLGRWQIPFLFLEMPHDGKSMYTLAAQIFQAIDDLMPGSEYIQHYTNNVKLNAERLLFTALNVAYELGVGMIVIDEAQNSTNVGKFQLVTPGMDEPTKQMSESRLMKLLISASNVGRIPLMFTGTMELMPTITTRGSPARRMVGRGSAAWRPLTREVAPKMPMSEFDLFMNTMFRCQWLQEPVKFDKDWADVFFEHTQGIPDYMVKLYESTQALAIRTQAPSMRIEHLRQAFQAEFEAGLPTLDTIQNPDDILKMCMPDMHGYLPIDVSAKSFAPRAPRHEAPVKEPMTPESLVAAIEQKKKAAVSRTAAPNAGRSPRPIEVDAEALARSDLRNSKVVPARPLGGTPGARQP